MLTTNLNKFSRLSPKERRLFFQAVLLLPMVHLGLTLLGYSRIRAAMENLAPLKPIDSVDPETETLRQAREISRVVSIAAQHGLYKAGCLRKSLLVWWFLRRAGIQSEICFGVRMLNRQLEAHAWVEYRGIVVNDSATIHERYQTLHDALPSTNLGL